MMAEVTAARKLLGYKAGGAGTIGTGAAQGNTKKVRLCTRLFNYR